MSIMLLDYNLLRDIMLRVLERPDFGYSLADFKIEGRKKESVYYHVSILNDLGFLAVRQIDGVIGCQYAEFVPFRITSRGQDFIAVAERQDIWDKCLAVFTLRSVGFTFNDFYTRLMNVNSNYKDD